MNMITRRRALLGLLAIPALVKASSLMPIRTPIIWRPEKPLDWVPCDGRCLDRRAYAELFSVLGHTYGGDQDTFRVPDTFNVPDLPDSPFKYKVATRSIQIEASDGHTFQNFTVPAGFVTLLFA